MRRGSKRGRAKFCDAGRGRGSFGYGGPVVLEAGREVRGKGYWDGLISLGGGIFIVLILEGRSLSILSY